MVGPIVEKPGWFLFLVFVSITQYSDFWVMSYENWKHILGVFSFHNSVFNGILVIKPIYMGPTVNALSSSVLPYVPTNNFFLHTKNPTHRNSSPFPNPSISLHTSSPLPNHADRAPTSSNLRRPQLRLANIMAKFWAWVLFLLSSSSSSSSSSFFFFFFFFFFY